MDAVTKLVYRSTLRSARKLDSRPALQALIHKDPRRDSDLPQDFHRTLSAFLSLQHSGGKLGPSVGDVSIEDRLYRLPDDSNTVTVAVQAAFHNQPSAPNWLDSCFMGMRYLNGICQAAKKHGLLPERSDKASLQSLDQEASGRYAQVRPQSLPTTGCILVSHPLLYQQHFNFFYQTVVLICEHSISGGTYGLTLNRLMSSKAAQAFDKLHPNMVLSELGSAVSGKASSGHLDLARDLPIALQAVMDAQAQHPDEPVHLVVLPNEGRGEPDAGSDSDSDGDGVRVVFESSEGKKEGDASQDQDDNPITLFQPAANRQGPGQMPQHARFTPQAAPTAEQSSRTAPDVTGDIADPRHPLRFHNVVSDLKRDKYPGDEQPLQEGSSDAQDQQEPDHESPPQDIQQQSSTDWVPEQADMEYLQNVAQGPAATEQNKLVPEQMESVASMWENVPASNDEQPSTAQPQSTAHDRESKDPVVQHHMSEIDILLDKMAGNPQTRHLRQRISDLRGRLNQVEEALRSRGQGDRHTTESDSVSDLSPDLPSAEGVLNDLNDLYMLATDKMLSKGGPVPAGQVVHDRQELGGQVVQEPSSSSSGLYVGTDLEKARQLQVSKELEKSPMRFFVGEAMWSSQQLETEMAQGKWMLLAPDQALLHRLCLEPQSFSPGHHGDGKHHERVRKDMWSHVMREAGPAHKDFCAITKELAKDLQQMQY